MTRERVPDRSGRACACRSSRRRRPSDPLLPRRVRSCNNAELIRYYHTAAVVRQPVRSGCDAIRVVFRQSPGEHTHAHIQRSLRVLLHREQVTTAHGHASTTPHPVFRRRCRFMSSMLWGHVRNARARASI